MVVKRSSRVVKVFGVCFDEFGMGEWSRDAVLSAERRFCCCESWIDGLERRTII